jgi:hypothetical protein
MQRALYFAYAAGVAGFSTLFLYIGNGVIAGADSGEGRYEGTVHETPGGGLAGELLFALPAGRPMITGGVVPADAPPVRMTFDLPAGFDDGRVVPVQTPLGPLNVRFEKFRDVP